MMIKQARNQSGKAKEEFLMERRSWKKKDGRIKKSLESVRLLFICKIFYLMICEYIKLLEHEENDLTVLCLNTEINWFLISKPFNWMKS